MLPYIDYEGMRGNKSDVNLSNRQLYPDDLSEEPLTEVDECRKYYQACGAVWCLDLSSCKADGTTETIGPDRETW